MSLKVANKHGTIATAKLRKFLLTDADQCLRLFYDTVHSINARDYRQQQLDAWAPNNLDAQKFSQSLLANQAYVVEHEGQILGFADISDAGYIDRLYVHKDWQGCGVAATLFNKLQHVATRAGLKLMYVEASITAKPFFEHVGFVVQKRQVVEKRGVKLDNFVMIKDIT